MSKFAPYLVIKKVIFVFTVLFSAVLLLTASATNDFYWLTSEDEKLFSSSDMATETALLEAIGNLKNHILQINALTSSEIIANHSTITANYSALGSSATIIEDAFELISIFETEVGPLFVTNNTKNGIERNPQQQSGLELERAMLTIQQGIIDFAYTQDNLVNNQNLFANTKFNTSSYFPGAVTPPTDATAAFEAKVNCRFKLPWGTKPFYTIQNEGTADALRPTGYYLAPGSLATITVPTNLVNKGFKIRVGAHAWDLKNKPTIKRMDRVSILYPITSQITTIANPLGGGIYIQVPPESDEGIASIYLTNVVASPFFSAKSFQQTSISEWQAIQRNNPGPWADFESDKVMFQVPSSWIRDFEDPESLIKEWDQAMNSITDMQGRPNYSDKHLNYMQVDVIFRGEAFFPGYPFSNYTYNPLSNNVPANTYFLQGPINFSNSEVHFHELGHQTAITKFDGEIEAIVNFLYVAVQNKVYGIDIDTAFKNSFSKELNIELDDAAETRIVTENFRQGLPRDITNSELNEVRYQHRGYAHYAEIVKLFGWCALENFWYSESVDFENGIVYDVNWPNQDDRILRMSKAAGVDLRPMLHFYGIHPNNPVALNQAIQQENLPPSLSIYNRLEYYKNIVPMNNAEFMAHALERFPGGLGNGSDSPNYGRGWYFAWSSMYNEYHGLSAQQALQNIINLYYPSGAPTTQEPTTTCQAFLIPGRISGNVNDNLRNPISNVSITLSNANNSITKTVLTNNQGFYEFDNLMPGDYTLLQTQPTSYSSVSDEDEAVDGDVGDTDRTTDNQIQVALNKGEDDNQNNFVEVINDEDIVTIQPVIEPAIENEHIRIYPNPFNDAIQISFNDNELFANSKTLTITLINTLGQVVYKTVKNNNDILYLDNLLLISKQLYIIKIVDSNGIVFMNKLIKL